MIPGRYLLPFPDADFYAEERPITHRGSTRPDTIAAGLMDSPRSIGTSFRQYVDIAHNTPRPAITVPAAFTVSAEPAMENFPRSLAERACTDIRHWSEPGRGGHFMPLEEPDTLAADIRAFFRSIHLVSIRIPNRVP